MDSPQLWDRQPGEPNRGFSRLEKYRLAGPQRSIRAVYQAEKAPQGVEGHRKLGVPASWQRASVTWRWAERAEAWDEKERARARLEYEEERSADRKFRIQLLKAYRSKLVDGLRSLNLNVDTGGDRVSVSDLTTAIRMIGAEMRAEYDQLPVQRIELSDLKAEAQRLATAFNLDVGQVLAEAARILEEKGD